MQQQQQQQQPYPYTQATKAAVAQHAQATSVVRAPAYNQVQKFKSKQPFFTLSSMRVHSTIYYRIC